MPTFLHSAASLLHTSLLTSTHPNSHSPSAASSSILLLLRSFLCRHSFTLLLLYSILRYSPIHTLTSHSPSAANSSILLLLRSYLCRHSFTVASLLRSSHFYTYLHFVCTTSPNRSLLRLLFLCFYPFQTNRSLWRLLFSKKRRFGRVYGENRSLLGLLFFCLL